MKEPNGDIIKEDNTLTLCFNYIWQIEQKQWVGVHIILSLVLHFACLNHQIRDITYYIGLQIYFMQMYDKKAT